MDMMNRIELKDELLQNVTGGDQKHYDELCEKAEAFVKVCVENGLSKAYYQFEMKKSWMIISEKACWQATNPETCGES